MENIIVFIFGLVIGSFLNAIIYRLKTDESVLTGRSHCRECSHILSWYDLIPVLSFILLQGKCRYCGKKISIQYPLVEMATGLLFILAAQNLFLPDIRGFVYFSYIAAIISFLIIIFVYDLKHYLILDKVIFPAIFFVLIYNIASIFIFNLSTSAVLINLLISAIGASAFFLLFVLISRGQWMGLGDVKLAFFMGLFLGWPNIFVALFLAFFLGAIIGIGLIIYGKKTMKSEVPFGPFLVTGTLLAFFFGEILIAKYFSFFSFYN